MRNWLLPEKFEDILPPQAQRIERMRAKLLELFRVHGYQLVIPPMLEYLESLLTDRKSTRLNSSHRTISYAVFCLKKKKQDNIHAYHLLRPRLPYSVHIPPSPLNRTLTP